MNLIEVYLVQADGAGWKKPVTVKEGTTVAQFFRDQVGTPQGRAAEDFMIRVNREACDANQQLRNGDVMSVSPRKVTGA